jgi:glutamate-1-semialdehyde 2,1-aminomutase
MDDTLAVFALPALAAGTLAWLLPKAKRRLELSRAKHRSLAGHARMAKRVAALIPGYAYDEAGFFGSDGAPGEVQVQRRAGFSLLASQFKALYARALRRLLKRANRCRTCSSPGATACPSSTAPTCASTSARAASCAPRRA